MLALRNTWNRLLNLVYRLPDTATIVLALVAGLCLSLPIGHVLDSGFYDSILDDCQPPGNFIGDCYAYARTSMGWTTGIAFVCVMFLAQWAASYLILKSIEHTGSVDKGDDRESYNANLSWSKTCSTVAGASGLLLILSVILVIGFNFGMPDTTEIWQRYYANWAIDSMQYLGK